MWCEKFESVKVCRCMFVCVKRTPNCAKTRKQSGCRVPLRKKFCTSEARKPFFAAGSCSRDCLIVLRILCFGYSLRYANERTNDYTARADFVKYLRLSRRNLCYILLRKRKRRKTNTPSFGALRGVPAGRGSGRPYERSKRGRLRSEKVGSEGETSPFEKTEPE